MSNPIEAAIKAREGEDADFMWVLLNPALVVRMFPEAIGMLLRDIAASMRDRANGQQLSGLKHVRVPEIDAHAFYRVVI